MAKQKLTQKQIESARQRSLIEFFNMKYNSLIGKNPKITVGLGRQQYDIEYIFKPLAILFGTEIIEHHIYKDKHIVNFYNANHELMMNIENKTEYDCYMIFFKAVQPNITDDDFVNKRYFKYIKKHAKNRDFLTWSHNNLKDKLICLKVQEPTLLYALGFDAIVEKEAFDIKNISLIKNADIVTHYSNSRRGAIYKELYEQIYDGIAS